MAQVNKRMRVERRSYVVFDYVVLSHVSPLNVCYYSNRYPDLEELRCFDTMYYFFPYIKLLFDNLMANNCFIYFFNNRSEEFHKPIVEKFLISKYGKERYEELLAEGQFKVFSRQHLDCGYKRLNKMVENVDDIMLVDSNDRHSEDEHLEIICLQPNEHPNTVSILMGLFMTFFEEQEKTGISLRRFVGTLRDWIPNEPIERWTYKDPTIELKFTVKGLLEIRKSVPDAVYHVPRDQTTYPIELMPSAKYTEKLIHDLFGGRRDIRDPNMILFQRQFPDYFASHALANLDNEMLGEYVMKSLTSGKIFHTDF